jgi:hypothetical protein
MKNFGGYQGMPLKPGMKAFLLRPLTGEGFNEGGELAFSFKQACPHHSPLPRAMRAGEGVFKAGKKFLRAYGLGGWSMDGMMASNLLRQFLAD